MTLRSTLEFVTWWNVNSYAFGGIGWIGGTIRLPSSLNSTIRAREHHNRFFRWCFRFAVTVRWSRLALISYVLVSVAWMIKRYMNHISNSWHLLKIMKTRHLHQCEQAVNDKDGLRSSMSGFLVDHRFKNSFAVYCPNSKPHLPVSKYEAGMRSQWSCILRHYLSS